MSAITRIACHDAPGEVRAAAFDTENRPVRLFLERWNGEGERVRVGERLAGRLRQISPKDGGAFFRTERGEDVFVRGQLPKGLSEGAEAVLEIRAEQRRGKLARGIWTEAPVEISASAFDRWRASLPGAGDVVLEEGPEIREDVARAFDEALLPRIGLPGGGTIEISRTSALIAVDIDTAGRQTRGSAGARAFSVNREAVGETARQLALRNLGGLVAIDCISPVHAEAGQALRKTFLEVFSGLSLRKAEALKPSRFGLLEAKLAWGEAPMEDRLLDEDGNPSGETELVALLRDAEREAEADRSGFLTLALSSRARAAYMARRETCDRILQARFSGRVRIAEELSEQSTVRRA